MWRLLQEVIGCVQRRASQTDLTDIAHNSVPRVCFPWSKRTGTTGESLGNPNPQKPKRKSMAVRYRQTEAFDFPIVILSTFHGDVISSLLWKPLGSCPSWMRHLSHRGKQPSHHLKRTHVHICYACWHNSAERTWAVVLLSVIWREQQGNRW